MVVLFQPPANLASLHSNHGIISSRVAGFALKDLGSDSSLLKKFVAPVQFVFNDIGEELLAAHAVPKGPAVKDIVQLTKDRRPFSISERGTLRRPGDDRFSCCTHGAYLSVSPQPL